MFGVCKRDFPFFVLIGEVVSVMFSFVLGVVVGGFFSLVRT